jgi:hypothetical protein
MVGLEKSLLFRERWKLHIRISTALENAKLDYETGQADLKATVARLKVVRDQYAEELPLGSREGE